jgi:large subunit ribosomal protein L23
MPKNREILIKPIISEKSLIIQGNGVYSFIIDKLANKKEVKEAVEALFKVKVESVRTVKIYAKRKRSRIGFVHTKVMKKALVQLQKGYDIESLKVN